MFFSSVVILEAREETGCKKCCLCLLGVNLNNKLLYELLLDRDSYTYQTCSNLVICTIRCTRVHFLLTLFLFLLVPLVPFGEAVK